MDEYYRGGANVPSETAAGTSGVQIATSGAISVGDFRGVTKPAIASVTLVLSGSYCLYYPAGSEGSAVPQVVVDGKAGFPCAGGGAVTMLNRYMVGNGNDMRIWCPGGVNANLPPITKISVNGNIFTLPAPTFDSGSRYFIDQSSNNPWGLYQGTQTVKVY